MEALHEIEIAVILVIQALGAWLAAPMRYISMLGYEEFFMLAMPFLYWCVDSALGVRAAVMLLLSNGLNPALKLLLHQPRPYWLDTQVTAYSTETSFGLPSGHSQTAASVWGIVAAYARRSWLRTAMIVIILLIGVSRIYLGVHFISDVLTGWLLGGLSVWAYVALEKRVLAWIRSRTLLTKGLVAFGTSILLMAMILLAALALEGWQMPVEWQQNAYLADPDNTLHPDDISGAFTTAGTWFGMMLGVAWLYQLQAGYRVEGTWTQRLLRYLVGMVGIIVLWYGLGQVFPREMDLVSYLLRYVRYTLVGLWVSVFAPLLFARIGLSGTTSRETPAFSTQ